MDNTNQKTKILMSKFYNVIAKLEIGNENLAAPIYLVIGTILDATLQLLIKKSSLTAFETLYFRALFICIINYNFQNQKKFYLNALIEQRTLIVCALLGAFHSVLYYTGLKILSLSEASIIYLTYNIWALFVAKIILNEPITYKKIINCVVSLIGLILITKPNVFFDDNSNREITKKLAGYCFVLSGSILYSISTILMKKMGIAIPVSLKLQYYHIMTLFLAVILICQQQSMVNIYNFDNLVSVIFIAIFTYGNHLLSFRAFSIKSLSTLAPFTLFNLIISIIYDVLFYDKFPSLFQLLGSGLILCAIITNIMN